MDLHEHVINMVFYAYEATCVMSQVMHLSLKDMADKLDTLKRKRPGKLYSFGFLIII